MTMHTSDFGPQKPPYFYLVLTILAIFLTNLATAAFGQVNVTDVLQPYRDFKPPEDMATRLMEGLLGPTYTSPLTAGIQTSTLFGAIFLVFNVIVFGVGTVWATYGVTAGIVQTAHEGVVLGKRMSAVWMPVRMVTGIGGLVPAFGGFSLSQVAMIIATSWGISFANYAYNQALIMANTSATLINAGFSRPNPNKDGNALALALFKQRLCELAHEKKAKDHADVGQTVAPENVLKNIPFSEIETSGTVVGKASGTNSDKQACYAVGLKRKTYLFGTIDQGGRWGSAMSFRSGAVDYKAISEQAWLGYAFNFPELVSRIRKIADSHSAEVLKNGGNIPYPLMDIRAVGVWYGGAVKMDSFQHRNISEDALKNMGKHGFFSAGSYYSTYAEVNAAVVQAADATDFVIKGPRNTDVLASGEYDYERWERGEAQADKQAPDTSSWFRNDTGNISFGQKLVGLMMDAGTAGAGGSSVMVDPIIALKNIGDYMMTIGEGLLATVLVSKGGGVSGAVVGGVLSAVGSVPIVGGLLEDILKALGGMAPYIGGLMFAVGALCAIYMPMVPFINWVSGLVQYCCIVVESFAAAPLWSLAHIQAEGEGMGQRTEKGYLYLLNLLFRPILMVVAFFAASALVILLGSLVFQMFMPAMAAAQGNSVTGIFSAIGYVFLFFVVLNIIIQGLFHLVMELPDDAIGWVGGIGRNNIGRDTEGKVSQMFMMGGRFGAGGVDRASTGAKTPPPSSNSGAGK